MGTCYQNLPISGPRDWDSVVAAPYQTNVKDVLAQWGCKKHKYDEVKDEDEDEDDDDDDDEEDEDDDDDDDNDGGGGVFDNDDDEDEDCDKDENDDQCWWFCLTHDVKLMTMIKRMMIMMVNIPTILWILQHLISGKSQFPSTFTFTLT